MSASNTRVNVRTRQFASTSTFQSPLEGGVDAVFGVLAGTEDVYLSIGHATPTVATSIVVPAGTGFELSFGVVGPVFIRTANAAVVSVYGA